MDFNFKKPLHILSLILIFITFFMIIILPILTFFQMFPTTDTVEVQELSDSIRLISELIILVVQLVFMFGLLVIIPILWYLMVNEIKVKEALSRAKLRLENIDIAFLWGIIAAITIFAAIFAISIILNAVGHESQDLSNIPDLQKLFSWPTLFFLVGVQPIAEEFFFRGFLFDKFERFGGGYFAIFITSILFGLAHMSYGKLFPVIMPMLMGVILGYIVYRTKNLYSSIVAHILFNVTALAIAYAGMELLKESTIIL